MSGIQFLKLRFFFRFGSLLRAYSLVGFRPDRDYEYVEINRILRRLHPEILEEVLSGFRGTGSDVGQDDADQLIVNGEVKASVVIVRCGSTSTGLLSWKLRFDTSLWPDITIVVRMDPGNREPLDFFIFPRLDVASQRLKLAEENGLSLDAYRFESLDYLYEMAAPVRFAEAA